MGGMQGSDITEPQILAEPQMLGAGMEWGVVTISEQCLPTHLITSISPVSLLSLFSVTLANSRSIC